MDVPQAHWMVYFMENPNLKWMMNRGTPILGNHHMETLPWNILKPSSVFFGDKNTSSETVVVVPYAFRFPSIYKSSGGRGITRFLRHPWCWDSPMNTADSLSTTDVLRLFHPLRSQSWWRNIFMELSLKIDGLFHWRSYETWMMNRGTPITGTPLLCVFFVAQRTVFSLKNPSKLSRKNRSPTLKILLSSPSIFFEESLGGHSESWL